MKSTSQALSIGVILPELESHGVVVTPFNLLLPETLDLDGWADIGRTLGHIDETIQWWIGDWAAFGLRKFEGKTDDRSGPIPGNPRPRRGLLKEFAGANALNYGTTANRAWVSRNVDPSLRSYGLDWSKYKEVAPLPAEQQAMWVQKCKEDSLTVAELRRQIRLSQGERNGLVGDGPAIESPRALIDDLLAWLKDRPDPTTDRAFWVDERRRTWKEWLQPIVEFAALL